MSIQLRLDLDADFGFPIFYSSEHFFMGGDLFCDSKSVRCMVVRDQKPGNLGLLVVTDHDRDMIQNIGAVSGPQKKGIYQRKAEQKQEGACIPMTFLSKFREKGCFPF